MQYDNPLIIQSDKTILLDVHSPRAEECRMALIPFAELERSPEHLHTYRLTPLSLWNACSAGIKSEQIIEVLIKDIKYRDLIFEYDDETYAVILPSFNLDKSMMFIQQLYANIENVIEDNGINARLAIGISTRSLRIIPAERIITEASQALDKALSQEGSIPVVAFRVDLEKYKKSLMED